MVDALPLVIAALEDASGAKTPENAFDELRNGKDMALDDLSLDSLSRFEVIMQIEEALDIELDEDEILAQKTVRGFADFVSQRATKA